MTISTSPPWEASGRRSPRRLSMWKRAERRPSDLKVQSRGPWTTHGTPSAKPETTATGERDGGAPPTSRSCSTPCTSTPRRVGCGRPSACPTPTGCRKGPNAMSLPASSRGTTRWPSGRWRSWRRGSLSSTSRKTTTSCSTNMANKPRLLPNGSQGTQGLLRACRREMAQGG